MSIESYNSKIDTKQYNQFYIHSFRPRTHFGPGSKGLVWQTLDRKKKKNALAVFVVFAMRILTLNRDPFRIILDVAYVCVCVYDCA